MPTIKGPFTVKSTPLETDAAAQEVGAMRMRFDKVFEGALDASSTVSMMGIMDMELKSGGYVAIEKVTGKLDGKQGSFCFQHSSTMDRGAQQQSITVIPDTGTDELKGLKGNLTVEIIEGKHYYDFSYEL